HTRLGRCHSRPLVDISAEHLRCTDNIARLPICQRDLTAGWGRIEGANHARLGRCPYPFPLARKPVHPLISASMRRARPHDFAERLSSGRRYWVASRTGTRGSGTFALESSRSTELRECRTSGEAPEVLCIQILILVPFGSKKGSETILAPT